jgi:hypothetical protein
MLVFTSWFFHYPTEEKQPAPRSVCGVRKGVLDEQERRHHYVL